jgi:hypothetical protein
MKRTFNKAEQQVKARKGRAENPDKKQIGS